MWKDRIRNLIEETDLEKNEDWKKSQQLISDLKNSNFVTPAVFDQIVTWKLRRQRNRTEHLRKEITPTNLKVITRAAFCVMHTNASAQLALKVKTLCALPGVNIGIASATLALKYPNMYGIIDFRVWKIVFNADRRQFSLKQYLQYQHELERFSSEIKVSPQKLDFYIWLLYDQPQ